jgi:hypothetical protein
MSNKKKFIHDRYEQLDAYKLYRGNGIQNTEIIIKDEVTGKVLFKGRNKVIIAGSAFTASKHFDISPIVALPNYNTELSLDQSVSGPAESISKVILFGVGTDGCGAESSQIYDVNYSKWTPASALIPFKYVDLASDILASERELYFGRKTLTDKIAYYFKTFEADPVMHMQYIDGTPVDANLYTSTNTTDVETFVELKLKVTNTDCRDYFKATTGIASAKINTITLLTAWAKTIDGYTYYQDILPLTKLNIQNEPLYDETKGLDIIYHIYY